MYENDKGLENQEEVRNMSRLKNVNAERKSCRRALAMLGLVSAALSPTLSLIESMIAHD